MSSVWFCNCRRSLIDLVPRSYFYISKLPGVLPSDGSIIVLKDRLTTPNDLFLPKAPMNYE